MNVCAGMFIAELFYDQADAKPAAVSAGSCKALPVLVLLTGMIIAGYPEKNAEWCLWSDYLKILGAKIFFPGAELSRTWGSVGTTLMLLGMLYLPPLQASLSHPFLVWMGKVSFSIFLIHSFLVRSVFCWMLYGYNRRGWNSSRRSIKTCKRSQYLDNLLHLLSSSLPSGSSLGRPC